MKISVAKRLSLIPSKQLRFFITVSSVIGAQFWLRTSNLDNLRNFNEPIELEPGDYTIELIPTDDGTTTGGGSIAITVPTDPNDPIVVDGVPITEDGSIEVGYVPNDTAILTVTITGPAGVGFILNGTTYYGSITTSLPTGKHELKFLKLDGYLEPGYIDGRTTGIVTIDLTESKEVVFEYIKDIDMSFPSYFALTTAGIFGSQDGNSWRYITDPLDLLLVNEYDEILQDACSNGKDCAIAISEKHAFRTTDGKTFTTLNLPPEDPAQPYWFTRVYYKWGYWFISGGYKILRSSDNGTTWQAFLHPYGLAGSTAYPIFYMDYAGNLYASNWANNTYKSTDLGETWSSVAPFVAGTGYIGKEDIFGKAVVRSTSSGLTTPLPIHSWGVKSYYPWEAWNNPAQYESWTTRPAVTPSSVYLGPEGPSEFGRKRINSFVFSEALCIGAGNNGQIITALVEKLTEWKVVKQEAGGEEFYSCGHINGLFFVGGHSLLSSTDGYNWITLDSSFLPAATFIAFFGLDSSYVEPPYVGEVNIAFNSDAIAESDGSFVAKISRINIKPQLTLGALTFPYKTDILYAEGSAAALPGVDYRAVKGTVSFTAGDVSEKTVLVPVHRDLITESTEKVGIYFGDHKSKQLTTYNAVIVGLLADSTATGQVVIYSPYSLTSDSYSVSDSGRITAGVKRDAAAGYELFVLALRATIGNPGKILKDSYVVGTLQPGERAKNFVLQVYARLYNTYAPELVLLAVAGSSCQLESPNVASLSAGSITAIPEFTEGDFSTISVLNTGYSEVTSEMLQLPTEALATSYVQFEKDKVTIANNVVAVKLIKRAAATYNPANRAVGKACTVTVALSSISSEPGGIVGIIQGSEKIISFPLGDAERAVSYYLAVPSWAFYRLHVVILSYSDCYPMTPSRVLVEGSTEHTAEGYIENIVYAIGEDPLNIVYSNY